MVYCCPPTFHTKERDTLFDCFLYLLDTSEKFISVKILKLGCTWTLNKVNIQTLLLNRKFLFLKNNCTKNCHDQNFKSCKDVFPAQVINSKINFISRKNNDLTPLMLKSPKALKNRKKNGKCVYKSTI